MLKGHILCKKGKQNTLLRKDIMSKSALFLLKLWFFFSERGIFFLCFFFAQTHWEDCHGPILFFCVEFGRHERYQKSYISVMFWPI